MVCFTTADQSSKVLQTMFDSKKYMDVSFLAGPNKKIIKAHRSVLTAALEDFDLIFSELFKENDDSTIVLDEIAPEIVESIVKFIYCGVIEIPDMDTAFQLWEPVHTVKIKSLQDHVLDYIKNNITIKNCLGVYLLAQNFNENYLASLSMGFAVSNMKSVIQEIEFVHLDKVHLVEFIKAAKQKDVNEEKIVKAALRWLNLIEQRQEHFGEILYLLDIKKINDSVKENFIRNEYLIILFSFLNLIDELEAMCGEVEHIRYISNALKKRCFNTDDLLPPKNNSRKEIMVVVQSIENNKTISVLDIISRTILGEDNINSNGIMLGIWKGTLILLQNTSKLDQSKITSYELKASKDIGVYKTSKYLDSVILDDELYIMTEDHCYTIDLISGRPLNKFDSPPTSKFRGVTSNKGVIYFILLKQHRGHSYKLQIEEYNRKSNLRKAFDLENTFQQTYKKCIGHKDCIYIFTENTVCVFDLTNKQLDYQSKVNISGISDAVSTKNKLIVIQSNTLYEFNLNYEFVKLQSSFSTLKKSCQIFSL